MNEIFSVWKKTIESKKTNMHLLHHIISLFDSFLHCTSKYRHHKSFIDLIILLASGSNLTHLFCNP